MPKVQTTTRSTKKKPPASGRKKSGAKQTAAPMVLPTEPIEAGGDFNDYSFLIHGVKKIGKTSLALQGGRVLIIQFDPPQRAYERMEVVCEQYDDFLRTLDALEKAAASGDYPYDRVVIDRVDIWYDECTRYACRKLAIDHPSDEDFGKGWAAVSNEFNHGVSRFLRLPGGKMFLCHSTYKPEQDRHGQEVWRLLPNLKKQADEILNGRCDAWFAYAYEGDERVIITQGNERTGAGHRIDGHFLTPEGGPVVTVPAGKSAEEAMQNLKDAFHNNQASTRGVVNRQKVAKKKKSKVQTRTRTK